MLAFRAAEADMHPSVECQLLYETGDAWKIRAAGKIVWVPKSISAWVGARDAAGNGTLRMAGWFTKKAGLTA